MKVEIWSDVVCPFCYIGKRNFQNALALFNDREKIEIEWKSYQLDPDFQYNPNSPEGEIEYIAQRKGIPVKQSAEIHNNVTNMAAQAGLEYHFDKAVMANTFDSHRVIQFAKKKGLGEVAEELFFKAFFTDGQNLNEKETLEKIGSEIGLTADEINMALTSDLYASEVKKDLLEARQIGVQGVPFFVFDRKYAVSGAQPVVTLLQTLEKAYNEWLIKIRPSQLTSSTEGSSCNSDGNCY